MRWGTNTGLHTPESVAVPADNGEAEQFGVALSHVLRRAPAHAKARAQAAAAGPSALLR